MGVGELVRIGSMLPTAVYLMSGSGTLAWGHIGEGGLVQDVISTRALKA